MQRRQFIASMPLVLATGAAMADTPKVQSLDDALRWLDRVAQAPQAKATGAWPLGTVLQHLAQSIEMSLDGFPLPKGALFQATAGAAAFAFFKWSGRMRHGLAEPIPGAPALARQADMQAGALRLRTAITRFHAHAGALKPHFAYGALGRADYALAHTLHIANHQDEITLA